jgi:hypothetical protein
MAKLIVIQDIVWDGTVARGGHTMFHMQWLHGFELLGHDVLLLDLVSSDFGEHRASMLREFEAIIARWWRPQQTALMVQPTGELLYGLTGPQLRRFADAAAVVITVGVPSRREPPAVIRHVRPRVLIDSDPAYTQLWVGDGNPADVYGSHDFYFTVGANIGSPRCRVPTFGIDWKSLWNPVVLSWWPPAPLANNRFTTIADWYSQGYVEFEGRLLGPKADEFQKFIDLPRLTGEEIEILMNTSLDDADVDRFTRHGWKVDDPARVRSPEMYRAFVSGSLAEFACAKGVYVGTRSGWFSDRSECFLAAGRPVVLQATGFEDFLPVGTGLLAPRTVEEAADAIRRIRADYATHADAARTIAREYFDSATVLARLLKDVGV